MPVELVKDTFAERIGERFMVVPDGGGEPFEVVLSECAQTVGGAPEQLAEQFGRVPFSLVFHAAERDRHWPQQTFTLRHDELGEFSLFMVPLGPDDRGMQYQAVIN